MQAPAGSLFGDPPDVLDGADGEESQDELLAQLGDSPAALHEYFMQGRNIAGLLRFPSISSAASQPPPQWRETHVLRADARIDRGSLRFAPAATTATTAPSVVLIEANITTVARVAVIGAVLTQDVQLARKVAIGSVAEAGHTTKFSAELIAVSVSDTVILEPGQSQPVRLNCTVDLARVSASDLAPRPDPAESYWPIVVLIQTLDTPASKRATTEPGPAASKSESGAAPRSETASGAITVDVLPATGAGGYRESQEASSGVLGPALPPAAAKFAIVADADGRVLEAAGGGGDADSDEEEEDAATAVIDASETGAGLASASATGSPVSLWGVAVPAMTQCVLTYCSVDVETADSTVASTVAQESTTASESVGVSAVMPRVEGEVAGRQERTLPTIRVVEEKVQVPQGVYVVREVFGGQAEDEDEDEGGEADATAAAAAAAAAAAECVVCLSAPRDTVLLPCRHMCVCSGCAQALRRQTNKCPVCRGIVSLMLRFDPASSPLDVPITTTLARPGMTEHAHEEEQTA